jgi:hypothetical protein
MNTTIQTRLFSIAIAALVTFSILGGVNGLAVSGHSQQALLAQQGSLQLAGSPVASGI